MLIKSRNQNIFPIFKFAVKFPFQQYIVCWGKICRSKIIGGSFYSVKLCNTFTIYDAFSISMVLSVVFLELHFVNFIRLWSRSRS